MQMVGGEMNYDEARAAARAGAVIETLENEDDRPLVWVGLRDGWTWTFEQWLSNEGHLPFADWTYRVAPGSVVAEPTPAPAPDMKHDGGKPRFDLMPWRASAQVIDVLTFGARKYAPQSWATVPDGYRRYFAAALRHLWARALGERLDPESGLPHLAHAACNVMFLCELDDGGKGTEL